VSHMHLTSPRLRQAQPRRIRHVRDIDQIRQLSPQEREQLREVTRRFDLRTNDYYLGLIDWDDPHDPIRRLIIPSLEELDEWGRMDASNEASVTVARGVQHKYPHTVLLLCNETCGAYCRYCFRKRLFIRKGDEVNNDVSDGIRYIADHPNVNNVLLTGGDPLLMTTRRLRSIIARLRAIPHVRVIRIGSKMPAFNPFRISDDPELLDLLAEFSTPRKRIYLVCHFDHPRELTHEAVEALDAVIRAGVICVNQCPLIRGINDDPAVLAELYSELSYVGCPPYYLFQCRPTIGNRPYAVPIVRGWEVFREAMRHGSGLSRRPRFVMSHELGKIEVLGVDEQHIYVRFHRAKDPEFRGQLLKYKRNDQAYWLDDLEPADGEARRYPPSPISDIESGPE
jgi:lysine 2,3-aminomutase